LANPDALFLSRVDDGIIVEANKGAESVLGFTKQEMIGRSGLDLNIYDDKKKRIKMVSTLEKQGYLRDYEMEINNKRLVWN
jgi:PAS domain S-box-containing protein